MPPVPQLLDAAAAGDPRAAAELLPLVYDELRKLAAAKLAIEKPGQTLEATALVHEAYLRLVGSDPAKPWGGRDHFFAAAAEAMRRILIEHARQKQTLKHGREWLRISLDEAVVDSTETPTQLLEFDEVLTRLQAVDGVAARLVQLRYYAGLTMEQAANVLGLSLRSAERNWTFARTWLHRELAARPAVDR
jgi:RNA polymerase sigma factor (TIGR02999 family)